MKRSTVQVFITILTFLIGITATSLIVQNLDVWDETAEIPTLNFCELSSNPQKYDGKIVRLNAILSYSQEGKWFYEPDCKTSDGAINPYSENPEIWKPIKRVKAQKDNESGADDLDVTAVGKFKIEETKNGLIIAPFQFELLQVDKVSKSSREVSWTY